MKKDRDEQAVRLLRHGVLRRVDGCAERGRPDGLWDFVGGFRGWLRAWFRFDWIDDCPAQAAVHGPLVETIGLLE